MSPSQDLLLCYYDQAEDPSLRFPGFVRTAFHRHWKRLAALDPDLPSPCSGRLHFQDQQWDLSITLSDEALLKRTT